MKHLPLIIAAINTVLLAACSSTPSNPYEAKSAAQTARQVEVQKQAVNNTPDWFVKPPANEKSVIYATGTSASFDWSIADRTAVDIALGKLCVSIGGQTSQQSKVYQRENNDDLQTLSETAIKSACPKIDVTGFVVEQRTQYADANGKVRVYVLVAYPMGSANTLATQKAVKADRAKTAENADKAFKELDDSTKGQ